MPVPWEGGNGTYTDLPKITTRVSILRDHNKKEMTAPLFDTPAYI